MEPLGYGTQEPKPQEALGDRSSLYRAILTLGLQVHTNNTYVGRLGACMRYLEPQGYSLLRHFMREPSNSNLHRGTKLNLKA